MNLTNIGLVDFVKSKLGIPYVYGMKGTVLTLAKFNSLKDLYPTMIPGGDKNKVGRVCVDCSGLISWYTGVQKGSSQYAAENQKQPISTIDKAPVGVAVWREGHIGVYAGNGEIIEAMGSAYGCVKTRVKNRDFTHWFKIRGIEYAEEAKEVVEKGTIIINDKEYSVDLIRKDGVTYIKTRDLGLSDRVSISNKGAVPVITIK